MINGSISPLGLLLTDGTGAMFEGLQHFTCFDWWILVPYFSILITFSLFGIHRYAIIITYFRHRSDLPDRRQLLFPVSDNYSSLPATITLFP